MSASSSERRVWLLTGLLLLGAGCGLIDLGPTSPDGSVPGACADGLDNDGDGRADFPEDPGCESSEDPLELDPATPRACSDGLDNDDDGRRDYDLRGDGQLDAEDDPGCQSASDDDESNVVLPACSDGVDNDADGLRDFPADTGCTSRNDMSEMP